jgi:hypothetical protein
MVFCVDNVAIDAVNKCVNEVFTRGVVKFQILGEVTRKRRSRAPGSAYAHACLHRKESPCLVARKQWPLKPDPQAATGDRPYEAILNVACSAKRQAVV